VWLPLFFIGALSYMDWLTHREIWFVLVVGGGGAAAILLWPLIKARLGLEPTLAQIPAWARPFLAVAPFVLYFVIRGQGRSNAGVLVALLSTAIVATTAFFGPAIDRRLAGFYAARNRILPRWLRLVLALSAPLVIALLVVHGSLFALPLLFGGTTDSPSYANGKAVPFALSTILSAGIVFLLLRERRSG
jgi:hypothetical protein